MNRPDDKRLAKGLWWDKNWGVVEGCSKVSPGCTNCFAEGYAHRFGKSLPYLDGLTDDKGHWTGKVNLRPWELEILFRRKKPTVWFVAERSDLFHESVPDTWIAKVFGAIGMCWAAKDARKDHLFIVLTKRPERMRKFLDHWEIFQDLPNILMGVTAENQEQADARIPVLLSIPAAKRFVSIEPMLGPIDLSAWTGCALCGASGKLTQCSSPEGDPLCHYCSVEVDGPYKGKSRLDWVICGGESGSGARPVHPNWVRRISDQCKLAGVPFFFKQWGEWTSKYPQDKSLTNRAMTYHHGTTFYRVGKKAAGRMLDGREYLGWPK